MRAMGTKTQSAAQKGIVSLSSHNVQAQKPYLLQIAVPLHKSLGHSCLLQHTHLKHITPLIMGKTTIKRRE